MKRVIESLSKNIQTRIENFKLPSRNWLIFIGFTGSTTGLIFYDKLKRKNILNEMKEKAAQVSKQPVGLR